MGTNIDHAAVPGLLRRLAAIFYDGWLIVAIWMVGVTVDTFVGAGSQGSHLGLQLYVIASTVTFFGWFWMHGGQTLGMRAWRLKLLSRDGGTVSLRQTLIRSAGALLSFLTLGLGYLWMLLDRDGLTLHDRLSGTRLVLIKRD